MDGSANTPRRDAYGFGQFGRDLANEVRLRIKDPLDGKIAMLEARVAALETLMSWKAPAANCDTSAHGATVMKPNAEIS